MHARQVRHLWYRQLWSNASPNSMGDSPDDMGSTRAPRNMFPCCEAAITHEGIVHVRRPCTGPRVSTPQMDAAQRQAHIVVKGCDVKPVKPRKLVPGTTRSAYGWQWQGKERGRKSGETYLSENGLEFRFGLCGGRALRCRCRVEEPESHKVSLISDARG